MTPEPAQHIMGYIESERARCATLVDMLKGEPEFLLYCIRAPVYPTEDLEHFRKLFQQTEPVPDDFEDLM